MANRLATLVFAVLLASCSTGDDPADDCPVVDMAGLVQCDGGSAFQAMYEMECNGGSVLVWTERNARYVITTSGYECNQHAFCPADHKIKRFWCRKPNR